MENEPLPRRWFQFRLRILFLLMLAMSVPLAKLGYSTQQFRREQQALEELELSGWWHGNSEIKHGLWELPIFDRVVAIWNLSGPKNCRPAKLADQLVTFSQLRSLGLTNFSWSEAEKSEFFNSLGNSMAIERLTLVNCDFSNEDARYILQFNCLRELYITETISNRDPLQGYFHSRFQGLKEALPSQIYVEYVQLPRER